MDAPRESKHKTALVLSGGAPNATLMAGALCKFHKAGTRFDVISVSGAGTAAGLIYRAPRGDDPVKLLEATVEQGVEDLLFRMLPVNFKVFQKPGFLADTYRRATAPWMKLAHHWLDSVIVGSQPLRDRAYDRRLLRRFIQDFAQIDTFDEKHFAHDVLDLWHSLLSPTWITPRSQGLCAHPPQLDDFVDLEKLRKLPEGSEFYMNSFNLTRGEMEIFSKDEITRDHFYAALAYPFFYPPYKMPNGDYYIEGAAIDALNFRGLLETCHYIRTIVVIDVAGKRQLMHPPRDLFDAFSQSIMTPLIEVARDDAKLFENRRKDEEWQRSVLALMKSAYEQVEGLSGMEPTEEELAGRKDLDWYLDHPPEVLKLPVEMSDSRWERSLDWSRSNLQAQYEIGYQAAETFLEEPKHRELLPSG